MHVCLWPDWFWKDFLHARFGDRISDLVKCLFLAPALKSLRITHTSFDRRWIILNNEYHWIPINWYREWRKDDLLDPNHGQFNMVKMICRGTILVSTPGLSTSSSRLRRNARHGRSNWKVSGPQRSMDIRYTCQLSQHGSLELDRSIAKACVEIYNEETTGDWVCDSPEPNSTHGKTSKSM